MLAVEMFGTCVLIITDCLNVLVESKAADFQIVALMMVMVCAIGHVLEHLQLHVEHFSHL